MTSDQRPIVVGVDGRSDSDELIMQWAATEARSRGCPLRVVHVYSEPVHYELTPYAGAAYIYTGNETTQSIRVEMHAQAAAEQILAAAMHHVRGVLTDHTACTTVAVNGRYASDVLVKESTTAELIIVGSRHRGTFASTFLGSVGAAVAAGAHCPVIVIRESAIDVDANHRDLCVVPALLRKPVVVGVDSSVVSSEVLTFAFEFAARNRRPLRAVQCWQPTAEYSRAWLVANQTDEQSEAALRLSMAIADLRERYPQVPVERRILCKSAVQALVSESQDAYMVVVGAHGRHAVLDRVLGSVSQGVLHRATCAVAIVHARR